MTRARPGFSILEVLMATVLFLVLLVPLLRMMMGANRAGVAANRLLEVTAYGQTVLEAAQLLTPDQLPLAAQNATGPFPVYESLGIPLASAPDAPPQLVQDGELSFTTIETYLGQPHFPFTLAKRLTVERLPGGHVAVELKLGFPRLPTDSGDNLHYIVLRGTLTARVP